MKKLLYLAASALAITSALLTAGAPSALALSTPSITPVILPENYAGVGLPIFIVVYLGEGEDPTGTITFALYPASDTTCSGSPVSTASTPVSGDEFYTTGNGTEGMMANAVGEYRVVAEYGGDAKNSPVSTGCNEMIISVKAAAALHVTSSEPAVVGEPLTVIGTLSGAVDPTGMVTFAVYGLTDETCEEAPLLTSTDDVVGDGADSGEFVPETVGTYYVRASYSGDAENLPSTLGCEEGREARLTVSPASPSIDLNISEPVRTGGTIAATASLVGAFRPTGAVTFTLFGPTDPNCTGPPAATVTSVLVAGRASSGRLTTSASGGYHFIAAYGGDANNAPAVTPCGSADVAVGPAQPTIAVTPYSVKSGSEIVGEKATLVGAFEPTGVVTFTLFGPNDPTCEKRPRFRVIAPVIDGTADSEGLMTGAAGVFEIVAAYSGDSNNAVAVTGCREGLVKVTAQPSGTRTTAARVGPGDSALVVHLACHSRDRAPCRGTVKVTTVEHLTRGGVDGVSTASDGRSSTRTVSVGGAKYEIAASSTSMVSVPLNRLGRALLARRKALSVHITLGEDSHHGTHAVISGTPLAVTSAGRG
jgi:hypothetical protein